jgi:hypothetical protein
LAADAPVTGAEMFLNKKSAAEFVTGTAMSGEICGTTIASVETGGRKRDPRRSSSSDPRYGSSPDCSSSPDPRPEHRHHDDADGRDHRGSEWEFGRE